MQSVQAILQGYPNRIIIGGLFAVFAFFHFSQLFLFSDGAYLAIKAYAAYFDNPTGWYPLDIDMRFTRFLNHLLFQLPVYLYGAAQELFFQHRLSFTQFVEVYALSYSVFYFMLYGLAVWLFHTPATKYFVLLVAAIQLPVFWIYSYETNTLIGLFLIIAALQQKKSEKLAHVFLIFALLANMVFIHEFYGIASMVLLLVVPRNHPRTYLIKGMLLSTILLNLYYWWQLPVGHFSGQYDQGVVVIAMQLLQIPWIILLNFILAGMAYFYFTASRQKYFWLCGGTIAAAILIWLYQQGDFTAGLITYRIWAFFIIMGVAVLYFWRPRVLNLSAFIKMTVIVFILNLSFLSVVLAQTHLEKRQILRALDQQSQIKLVAAGQGYGRNLPLFSIVFSGDQFCQIALNQSYVKENMHKLQKVFDNGDQLLVVEGRVYPWLIHTITSPWHIYTPGLDGVMLDITQLPMYHCPTVLPILG